MKYKNLLFDLGGVIMDIRRENCVEAFRELGMADPDRYLGEYSQAGVFAGIENGSLSVDQFHNQIREIIGRPQITDAMIDDAFGRFLVGIPLHRLRQLEELHSQYRLYLLSNTNPIMWADGIARAFKSDGHDIDFYFDGIVTSFEAKVMKPDPLIFEIVMARLDIDPRQTLFFDDSKANIDAAADLGFHTVLVQPGTEFHDLLQLRLDAETHR